MSDWTKCSIDNACHILDNLRIPISEIERNKRKGNVPYYGANGIQGYIDGYIFNEKLVLLAEDGGNFEDYSKRPIAYRIDGYSWVNNHAHVLKAKSDFDIDFIFYSLQHKNILRHITGGTRGKLNQSELKSIVIECPSDFKEQKTIATILDAIDEAIAAAAAQLVKQEKIKQGLLQDLLTRGIDETGQIRPHWEDWPNLYKKTEFGWLPREWEIKRLETVTSHIVDCPHTTPSFVENGVLVARTFNIKDGAFINDSASYVTESEYIERISRLEPQAGDLIFTREAPVGEAFVIPNGMRICLGQRTMLIRGDKQHCLPDYLVETLYSPKMRIRFDQIVGGTTNPHLNVSDLRQLLIVLPNIYEQELISKRLASIRKTLNDFRAEKYKLEKIKTGLMQDLLTGQRRVTPELIRQVETLTGSA